MDQKCQKCIAKLNKILEDHRELKRACLEHAQKDYEAANCLCEEVGRAVKREAIPCKALSRTSSPP